MHEEILHKTKEKVISDKLIITLQQQRYALYNSTYNSWISISRNQSAKLNLEMQENKDWNGVNQTVRGKITLTSVCSAHTFFSFPFIFAQ